MSESLVKSSVIRFDLPFMINLPDGTYDVNLGDANAAVSLKGEGVERNKAVPYSMSIPNNGYIVGDRWGRLRYTRASIRLYHSIFVKYHLRIQDYLLELSVRSINRMLEVCREITRDHYIRISMSDIFFYEAELIGINNEVIPGGILGLAKGSIVSMGEAGAPSLNQLDTIDY